jgi:hypothetical protein
MMMAPDMADTINGHIDSIFSALRPWPSGGCYFNFADRPADSTSSTTPDTRLGRKPVAAAPARVSEPH